MVWFLLGLLFNATGLYLGFEYSLAFGYMLLGWACCAYGLAILVLRILDNPKKSMATRLSPKFISMGSPVTMPAMPDVENERVKERSATE